MLTLRAGRNVCDRDPIVRFAPDDASYPSPDPAAASGASQAPPVTGDVPFGDIIDRVSAAHHGRLVRAISVESAPGACAIAKGAMGLMQLMPATARRFNVTDPHNRRPTSRAASGICARCWTVWNGWPWRRITGEAAVDRFRGIPQCRNARLCNARAASRWSITADNPFVDRAFDNARLLQSVADLRVCYTFEPIMSFVTTNCRGRG